MLTDRHSLSESLQAYGALPSQVVDLTRDDQPRLLSYLDLRTDSPGWRLPTVVENAGRPCVHVFDGRSSVTEPEIAQWCWRIALRGDGAWVGVLEPGRLRVYRAVVSGRQVRPLEVESATPGEWALPKFLNEASAGGDDLPRRKYLKQLLDQSAQAAIGYGLSQEDALSLVGRGLFWRFLLDRKLLAGLRPEDICHSAKSWEQCLDNRSRALRTFAWLNETFNGGLLPFEARPQDFEPRVFSEVLGNIAHGATATGQLRLPSDWKEVNFSYVPVGLLSEVYEAFAHSMNADEAARKSIHYTPSHLVEFIVTQALAQLPTGSRPRVLDPTVGAGVFLVVALRKLVEREWLEKGERPKRRRIREILCRQLAGFDTDLRALRLAELALYLTALELDPHPKPLNELRFDELRGSVLFDVAHREHGSLGPVDGRFRHRFDLVLGNPPWTARPRGLAEKKAWVRDSSGIVEERLGETRAKGFDFPDTNTDMPFVWRAMEWAKDGGRIALVTHARWLFGISDRATAARNDVLQATRVTGILNGSALRKTKVWPKVDAPWCVLFATNERPEPFDRAAFHFVSPALDSAGEGDQARFRVDWLDAHTVLAEEVLSRPWALKARFKGDRLAMRALDSMQMHGLELGRYLAELGAELRNGYQIGAKAGKQRPAGELRELPSLKDADDLGFLIDVGGLPKLPHDTLLFARARSIYSAPLLLLRKAIPADPFVARAHLALEDVAYHESFHGASFARIPSGEESARYLQLVLQSSIFPFYAILTDPQYGVFVDAVYLENVRRLPVVPFETLLREQRVLALQLSRELTRGMTQDLAGRIDELVFDTFSLSRVERDAIRDKLETSLPSIASKRRAVAPPTPLQRQQFIETLRSSLDCVLSASGLRSAVRAFPHQKTGPWRLIEVAIARGDAPPSPEFPQTRFLEEADANGASLVTVQASQTTWFLGLLERYALWTPTRARLLANDLLTERSRA